MKSKSEIKVSNNKDKLKFKITMKIRGLSEDDTNELMDHVISYVSEKFGDSAGDSEENNKEE